jgi:hypothetical protein
MITMARGDRGYAKAKDRADAGNSEKKAFLKKGEEAGSRGKPKLTRADVKRAKTMQPGEHSGD